MRLVVFNGSPRRGKSNTKVLLDRFLAGFESAGGGSYETHFLQPVKDVESRIESFESADCVLLAFPLYTDAMPAPVHAFVEALAPLRGREGNPDVGFIVHSGFPEAFHSRYLERYLEKLARRLGCRYLGTVIKGGSEGIQTMPGSMTRKLFERFTLLGKRFGETGAFDEQIRRELASPERFKGFGVLIAKLMMGIFANNYWNSQLKANGAFDKRFARPYRE